MAESSPTPTNGFQGPGAVWVEGGLKEAGKAVGVGNLESGWIDDLVRKHVLSHGSGIAAILTAIGSNLDDILAVIVHFMDALQAQNSPGFFTLMAELLSGIAGFEISADHVHAGFQRGGTYGGFTAVGEGYWDGMITQLGAPQTLTPESGLKAAQGFLGYLLGFSIREGNLGFLTSLIPEEWRVLDGIDEYARAMRSSLGLGRMARQALHPLIQTIITDPLQWYVNQTYTPKLLGESTALRLFHRGLIDQNTLTQELTYAGYSANRAAALTNDAAQMLGATTAIRAFNRGLINQNALNAEMTWAGYTPERAAVLQQDALTQLSITDAWTLYKRGKYTSQQLEAAWTNQGMNPAISGDWIEARILADVEPYITVLVQDWKTQLAGGYISLPDFESNIDQLGLLPDVAAALKISVAQLYEFPRKKLTLAELQSAFVEGLIDSTEVADWLKREGYSDDDQVTLWYQTLLKLGTSEAKKAVAQYAYDKAVARAEKAGEPAPPKPPILAVGPT